MTDMTKESEALMTKLKNQTRIREINKSKRKWYVDRFKKVTKWAGIAVGSFLLVFYPTETGAVIGTFIHKFFGTIIQKSIGQ